MSVSIIYMDVEGNLHREGCETRETRGCCIGLTCDSLFSKSMIVIESNKMSNSMRDHSKNAYRVYADRRESAF